MLKHGNFFHHENFKICMSEKEFAFLMLVSSHNLTSICTSFSSLYCPHGSCAYCWIHVSILTENWFTHGHSYYFLFEKYFKINLVDRKNLLKSCSFNFVNCVFPPDFFYSLLFLWPAASGGRLDQENSTGRARNKCVSKNFAQFFSFFL
jgi:hypothetical protein